MLYTEPVEEVYESLHVGIQFNVFRANNLHVTVSVSKNARSTDGHYR